MPVNKRFNLYMIMLGMITAMPPLSIDIGLPALPNMSVDLGTATAVATQTLALFILGNALAPVLFGPLSDRIGRRPVLVAGLLVYTVAAVGCTFAPSMDMLLSLRFVQGCAAGAAGVLPMAIVRDRFTGTEARKLQSTLAMLNSVAPMIAPLIGGALMWFFGWRAVYGFLAAAGLGLTVLAYTQYLETRQAHPEPPGHSVFTAYRITLSDRQYLTSALVVAFNFGGLFAYITTSPLVFVEHFGTSASAYASIFALTALGTFSGAMLNKRLAVRRVADTSILRAATLASVVFSTTQLGCALLGYSPISLVIFLVLGANVCTGMVLPNGTHKALENLSSTAGTGAALLRSSQMLSAAAATFVITLIHELGSLKSMAIVMCVCSVSSLVCFIYANAVSNHRQSCTSILD